MAIVAPWRLIMLIQGEAKDGIISLRGGTMALHCVP